MTNETIMPFGKFKGRKLEDLPDWYKKWLLETLSRAAPNKRSLQDKHLITYLESCQKT